MQSHFLNNFFVCFPFIYLRFIIIHYIVFSPVDMFIFENIINIHTQVQIFFVHQFGLHLNNVLTILPMHFCVTENEYWHSEVMYVRSFDSIKTSETQKKNPCNLVSLQNRLGSADDLQLLISLREGTFQHLLPRLAGGI